MNNTRKILFLTGTRADYGKIKSLMLEVENSNEFELYIFVTGMHMFSSYGETYREVITDGYKNLHLYVNQKIGDSLDIILSKTIAGLSDYAKEINPDLIVVHGDRVEALAAASVGSLNNILVGHIEGGEMSGTIDDLIRHSVTKLSHIHFVSNDLAKKRLMQMGEIENSVKVIGSPDIDIMNSNDLPEISDVKKHYEIFFDEYSIFMFHPVTTELDKLHIEIIEIIDSLIKSDKNYIVIYPNNDPGSEIIMRELDRLKNNKKFRLYPSMRFESFITLLKNSRFIIGNSSAGIREAPHLGIFCINIGSRQKNRALSSMVVNIKPKESDIINAICSLDDKERFFDKNFGDGNSAKSFIENLRDDKFWETEKQKKFQELNFQL